MCLFFCSPNLLKSSFIIEVVPHFGSLSFAPAPDLADLGRPKSSLSLAGPSALAKADKRLNYYWCCYYCCYFGCPFERPCIYFVLYAAKMIRTAIIIKVTMNLD